MANASIKDFEPAQLLEPDASESLPGRLWSGPFAWDRGEDRTHPPAAPPPAATYYIEIEGPGTNGTQPVDVAAPRLPEPSSQATPVVKPFPRRPRLSERYRIIQQWEGAVTEVRDESFVARLRDLTNPSHPDELAEFAASEVHEDDLSLLSVGAVFYWAVGHLHQANGQRRLTSELRFRRLPQWTKADLEKLDEPSDLDELFDDR